MTRTTISQDDLARNPQDVVDRVQRSGAAVIERAGQEQVVLLDPLDFRLLQALARCALDEGERGEDEDPAVAVMETYLAEQISLGKAAELLGLSWFDLRDRFNRLGVPLRLGPSNLDEARAEVAAALKIG